MVILRPTRKLRSQLPVDVVAGQSDTALGDWYVNRIVVCRQPLLLLVSSTSLLPILVPARDVRSLPSRLGALVERRLRRAGVEARAIAAERQAMAEVRIGPTTDRSVLGVMTDFSMSVPYYVQPGRLDEDALTAAEDALAETPCHAMTPNTIFPQREALSLLRSQWLPRK